MDLLDKLLSNKIVNTNGYTRSDTGTKVHSYLRTHPKNQGLTKSARRLKSEKVGSWPGKTKSGKLRKVS